MYCSIFSRELVLRDGLVVLDEIAHDVGLRAGLELHADIGGAVLAVAHLNDDQARLVAGVAGLLVGDVAGKALADAFGNGIAVDLVWPSCLRASGRSSGRLQAHMVSCRRVAAVCERRWCWGGAVSGEEDVGIQISQGNE